MSDIEPILAELLSNQVFAWLIFGGLGFWAIRWQLCLLISDYRNFRQYAKYADVAIYKVFPNRVRTCIFICFLIALGNVVEAMIAVQTGISAIFPVEQVVANIVALLPFAIVFSIKSYFGPIVTVGTLAFVIFYYINFQIILMPPLLESLFNIATSLLPNWMKEFYIVGFTVYALASSWHDVNVT